MKKLNCLIIEDEPLACKGLMEYIREVDSLHFLEAVHNPADGIKYLPDTDLLYLDINMPKISGIDFLREVKNPPLTIITTAYPQYALQGYELDVVDYLLKPISFARFLKASTKAIEYFRLRSEKTSGSDADDYFFVKSNGVLEKVFIAEIIAVEALANYITLHCLDKKITAYLTLKQAKEYLPSSAFLQVHKSFLVARHRIDRIDHDEIILARLTVPIGANYKEVLNQEVLGGKILKR
jgi:DNA-binding LytR/AlgR family response regulator